MRDSFGKSCLLMQCIQFPSKHAVMQKILPQLSFLFLYSIAMESDDVITFKWVK